MPDAVMRPVQYAVAVNRNGPAGRLAACVAGAGGGSCGGGSCGGGVWGGGVWGGGAG